MGFRRSGTSCVVAGLIRVFRDHVRPVCSAEKVPEPVPVSSRVLPNSSASPTFSETMNREIYGDGSMI